MRVGFEYSAPPDIYGQLVFICQVDEKNNYQSYPAKKLLQVADRIDSLRFNR